VEEVPRIVKVRMGGDSEGAPPPETPPKTPHCPGPSAAPAEKTWYRAQKCLYRFLPCQSLPRWAGLEPGDRGGWAGEVLGVLGVLETGAEVSQNVHISNIGFVGAVVGVEVLMHIAVGEEFGTHVVEVVAGLET
jgi:hypothetical protein